MKINCDRGWNLGRIGGKLKAMSESPPGSLFPNPRYAPRDAPLAMGGELTAPMLKDAYRHGVFPWYSPGQPILWWSPDPRFVLRPAELKIQRSLAKEMRKPHWKVTYDQSFGEVIRACADAPRPGQDGTWITEEIIAGYEALHRAGIAHSVECWRDGALAGGCYGIAMGSMFAGESMFFRRPDASKVAFATLALRLRDSGFRFIDCQQPTSHLARFGATEWRRDQFLDELSIAVRESGCW
ncbi:leucyl/phenylalanyl-tRNA--protein transferase [Cerasicoccus frondis]|uniref:leucyl/phenylalanyl-tRNA--protein transferase n=1 Tax=Cerasicoccus frondis TaxID=490090 RepID=UPI0028525C5F|nr:leucyl/phenylalanyl-tRNA--protein transferase [Cerasicoccus frondis]